MLRPAKLFLLFVGCLLFSFSDRTSHLTYEQHLLSAASDHYYLLYFMLPVTLLCYFPYLEDDSEILISRFPRYISYFLRKWVVMGAIAAIMVAAQCVAITLSSIGRGTGNFWNLPSDAIETELFEHLQVFFSTPLRAFFVLTVFQWLGMWFVAGLLMWICRFTNVRTTTIIMVPMYVFSVLWIKADPLQKLPISGLNHFMILHHNLIVSNRLYLTLGTEVALLAVILVTAFYWHGGSISSVRNGGGLTDYYRKTLFTPQNMEILLIALAGVAIYKAGKGVGITSSHEWLEHFFAGHGISGFRPLAFLEMLIVNGTPLYLLAGFIEWSVSEQSLFIPARVSTRKSLTLSCLAVGFEFISLYCLLVCAFAGCSGAMRGFVFGKDDFLFLLLLTAFKLADCCLQYLTMFLIFSYTNQITIGFVTLVIGNMLCMLPEEVSQWIPFGASSVARFYEIDSSAAAVALRIGYTLMFTVPLAAWTVCVGRHKQFD